jgi:hypothetical protein
VDVLRRWGWLLWLVLAHEASATQCAISPIHAQRLAQGKFAESTAIWVGRIVALGDRLSAPAVDWDQRQTVRFQVERWIKGSGGSEIDAVLPLVNVSGVGARLLVFARPNLPDEQLKQIQGRREARRWLTQEAGAQALQSSPAEENSFASSLPTLSAGHRCEQRVFNMQSDDAHARSIFSTAPQPLNYSADALLWWLDAATPSDVRHPQEAANPAR